MPTMLEAAGIAVPAEVQGTSLLGIASNPDSPWARDAVFTEQTTHVHYIPCRAARTRAWKYIRNWSDNAFGLDQNAHDDWAHRMCELPGHPWLRPRPEEELYDLRADPQEQRNLARAARSREELEAMRALLEAHMAATGDPYLDRPFTRDFDPARYARVEPGHAYW